MVDKISSARKKELEQPDPFLESLYRGVGTAQKYKKPLIGLFCAVVIVFLIGYGTVYTIKSSDLKASEMLSEALSRYADGENPGTGYTAVKDDFLKLLDEYPNTSAGRLALLRFAEICYKAAAYDQAFIYYEKALHKFRDDPAMKNLLLSSLGHTSQALKKYGDAEKYFKTIVDGNNTLLTDEALFNLGILAMENGNNEKGMQWFSRIVSEHPQSMYKTMAETLIAKK